MEKSAVLPRLAAAACLLALALAAVLASPEGDGGALATRILAAARGAGSGLRLASTVVLSLSLGAGLLLLAVLAAFRLLDRKSGRSTRRERYSEASKRALWGLLVIVAITLILPRLYGGLSEQLMARAPEVDGSMVPAAPSAPLAAELAPTADDASMASLAPMTAIALAAGGALLAAAAAAFVLRRGRRGGDDGGDIDFAALAQEAAAEAARRARRRLELGDPFRDTIVECYAAMCAIFADRLEAGGARTEHLTARELAARLAALGAGEPETRTLTVAFEKARYSNEECGAEDREAAVAALAALGKPHGEGA